MVSPAVAHPPSPSTQGAAAGLARLAGRHRRGSRPLPDVEAVGARRQGTQPHPDSRTWPQGAAERPCRLRSARLSAAARARGRSFVVPAATGDDIAWRGGRQILRVLAAVAHVPPSSCVGCVGSHAWDDVSSISSATTRVELAEPMSAQLGSSGCAHSGGRSLSSSFISAISASCASTMLRARSTAPEFWPPEASSSAIWTAPR